MVLDLKLFLGSACFGRLDSDPDFHWECGPGSRWAKMTHKKEKCRNVFFQSAGCSLMRAGGFSCCLDVLHGSLGINILNFFFFNNLDFFCCFSCHQIQIRSTLLIDLKYWIRIRIAKNADPKNCLITTVDAPQVGDLNFSVLQPVLERAPPKEGQKYKMIKLLYF